MSNLDLLSSFTMEGLGFLSTPFIFVIGLAVLAVAVVFVIDITQKRDAVRRNFPVLGRFRYVFSKLGEFFRQCFVAMDRDEMPFNSLSVNRLPSRRRFMTAQCLLTRRRFQRPLAP